MDREAIIRKLVGIKAKMTNAASTEAEVESYTRMYNNLMRKYNLKETDIHIKEQGVGSKTFTPRKDSVHEVVFLSNVIAVVTETRVVTLNKTSVVFFGTQADIDYAEFLFRLCFNAIEQATTAFKASPLFEKINKLGRPVDEVIANFRVGFTINLNERLTKIAIENEKERGTGNALIVLKNQLIAQMLDELGGTKPSDQALALYQGGNLDALAGFAEGDKVILRRQAEAQKVIEGK